MKIDILSLDLSKKSATIRISLAKRHFASEPYYNCTEEEALERVSSELKEQHENVLSCSFNSKFPYLCNKYSYSPREAELEVSLSLKEEKKRHKKSKEKLSPKKFKGSD